MNKLYIIILLPLLFGAIAFVAANKLRRASFPPHADIVVFAPHPDDAVLCCAGVIQQAIVQGKKVLVIDITNGDDFASAAAQVFGKPQQSLTPKDMIRFARIRQTEELRALRVLGLVPANVIFLGYPDGGLDDVYRAQNEPYFHPLTQKYATYEARKPDYHSSLHRIPALYTQAYALADITEIIQKTNPSEIYVTSDMDEALDHRAAFWLVRDSLRSLRYAGRLSTAVIHGADRPHLPSPASRIPLTNQQMENKRKAIAAYRSQLDMHDFPFASFVKSEEIFWTL